jgi:hypothetical protein
MSLKVLERCRYLVTVTVFFVAASAACAETERGEVKEGLNQVAQSLCWVAAAIAFAGVVIGAGIYSFGQLLVRRRTPAPSAPLPHWVGIALLVILVGVLVLGYFLLWPAPRPDVP